ncbi:hypothetical protein LXL04_037794 [Taraxacum kok-saghyz]
MEVKNAHVITPAPATYVLRAKRAPQRVVRRTRGGTKTRLFLSLDDVDLKLCNSDDGVETAESTVIGVRADGENEYGVGCGRRG